MLVLSRKVGERIYIGDDIYVDVRKVAGNRVSLAIVAPRNIRILRGELKNVEDSFHVLQDSDETEQLAADTVIIGNDDSAKNHGEAPQTQATKPAEMAKPVQPR